MEDVDLPVVGQLVVVGQQFFDHHASRFDVGSAPLQGSWEFLSQTPPKGPFYPPFRPRHPVLVAPVSDDTVAVVPAREQPEFSRKVGKWDRTVVHDEQRIARPVVGFDDAALGKVVPIDDHVLRPVIQFREMTHLFGRHECSRTVLVFHQGEQRVAVFHAPFEQPLGEVPGLGRIIGVPGMDTAREQLGHRFNQSRRSLYSSHQRPQPWRPASNISRRLPSCSISRAMSEPPMSSP